MFHFTRSWHGDGVQQCHRQDRAQSELGVGAVRGRDAWTRDSEEQRMSISIRVDPWSCRAEGKETDNFPTVFPIPSLTLVLAVASNHCSVHFAFSQCLSVSQPALTLQHCCPSVWPLL